MRACGSNGNVIIATLVAITLVSSLSATVAFMALADSRGSTRLLDRARALAAAEAGAVLQFEALRMGGGTTTRAGSFGPATYSVGPATKVSGTTDCWRIESTGYMYKDHSTHEIRRGFEMYVSMSQPSPPHAAIGIQERGLLYASFPNSTTWRISGHDTRPPSVSGAPWDSPTVGDGPGGLNEEYGIAVYDPAQRLAISGQLARLPSTVRDQLDGRNGEGMRTVQRDRRVSLDLDKVAPQLESIGIVIDEPTDETTFGTPTSQKVVVLKDGAHLDSLTGYGILLVRSSNLEIDGDLKWEGIVMIFSDSKVGLHDFVGGRSWVYGAVIIQHPARVDMNLCADNAKIFYSSQAVAAANALLPGVDSKILATNVLVR